MSQVYFKAHQLMLIKFFQKYTLLVKTKSDLNNSDRNLMLSSRETMSELLPRQDYSKIEDEKPVENINNGILKVDQLGEMFNIMLSNF